MLNTQLKAEHEKLGASFTEFGGWNMPVRYGSDIDEHHSVRNGCGLFDISHMAEIRVTGQAEDFLDYALISKLSEIENGRAKYSMICAEDGGIIEVQASSEDVPFKASEMAELTRLAAKGIAELCEMQAAALKG